MHGDDNSVIGAKNEVEGNKNTVKGENNKIGHLDSNELDEL